MNDEGLLEEDALDKAIRFQNGLIAHATSGGFDGGDEVYKELLRRDNQDENAYCRT